MYVSGKKGHRFTQSPSNIQFSLTIPRPGRVGMPLFFFFSSRLSSRVSEPASQPWANTFD